MLTPLRGESMALNTTALGSDTAPKSLIAPFTRTEQRLTLSL